MDFRQMSMKIMDFQQFPKSILESITILFGTFCCVIFVSNSTDKTEIITTLGTLTVGAQKLLPACQQIYSSWVGIKSNVSSAEVLLGLLEQNTRIVKKTSNLSGNLIGKFIIFFRAK